jgi:N-glycosylase/DNA lyase
MHTPPPGIQDCDWHRLHDDYGFTHRTLRETLDGGQAFRWFYDETRGWCGVFSKTYVELRLSGSGEILFRSPDPDADLHLKRYLGRPDLAVVARDLLPWRSDPVLGEAMSLFPGLTILRQPFGEVLLGFLCSATKQIVQIKQCVNELAMRFGDEIAPGGPRALPTWEKLACVPEAEIRATGVGFRGRYIAAVARELASEPGLLDRIEKAPYEEARELLMELPGVGGKVADCVLLFGAGRLEAFPVDVWILRAMARRYGLDGWKPEQVAHFGRIHFGAAAGLAQQYLFALERAGV